MNNTIKTFTGRYVDLINPDPSTINILDIAHALGAMPRFAGHTKKFYSVAEHSVQCAIRVEHGIRLEMVALLHDASEAYLMDIPRPLKQNLPEYKAIEERMMRAIFAKFELPYEDMLLIKQVDNELLEIEMECVFLGVGPFDYHKPEQAEKNFLEVFHVITIGENF